MRKQVFKKLLKQQLTIAFAESMTGGSLAYEMIKNPGSSKVMKGSIVAYNAEQKRQLLAILKKDIDTYGIVSAEIAVHMAKNIRKLMTADIGVGITGNAGPTLQEETVALEAFVAIVTPENTYVNHLDFQGLSRLQSIKKAIEVTYQKLYEIL